MIQVRGLVKAFGLQVALRGVDLDVTAGEFLTVLGPNGAGKTTLLRVLATLSKPTAGVVRIAGHDAGTAGSQVRRLIGLVSHQTLLYPHLSAENNLCFYGRMYDVADLETRVSEVLNLVGLKTRRADLVRTFSRGMQQRLAIARAILHRPRVMFFDEPYTGLDQQAASVLSEILSSVAAAGRTVLLTTHNLERGLAGCDRVVILDRGQVVHQVARTEIEPASFAALYQSIVRRESRSTSLALRQ
jgi:heme ABC exporter ATP-binding subunit CcmA